MEHHCLAQRRAQQRRHQGRQRPHPGPAFDARAREAAFHPLDPRREGQIASRAGQPQILGPNPHQERRILDIERCHESHGGSLLDLHRMVHQRGPQQVDRRIAEDPCHVQRYRMQQNIDGPDLLLLQAPLRHHRRGAAQGQSNLAAAGGHRHGHALLPGRGADGGQVLQHVDGLDIRQPRQRIIQQQQRRPAGQGTRQRQSALTHQRQIGRHQRQAVAQPHGMGQRDDLFFQELAARHAQRDRDVLPDREARIVGAACIHQRHLAVAGAIKRHFAAMDLQTTGIGAQLPGQHSKQRRLACPGRPHDGQRPPEGDVQRQRAQDVPASIPQADPVAANRHAE